jgi:hypothetical protein
METVMVACGGIILQSLQGDHHWDVAEPNTSIPRFVSSVPRMGTDASG